MPTGAAFRTVFDAFAGWFAGLMGRFGLRTLIVLGKGLPDF
jgi:hypothetical protein